MKAIVPNPIQELRPPALGKGIPIPWLDPLVKAVIGFIPGVGGIIDTGIGLAETVAKSSVQSAPQVGQVVTDYVSSNTGMQLPRISSLPGAGYAAGGPQPTPPNTAMPGGKPHRARLRRLRPATRRQRRMRY